MKTEGGHRHGHSNMSHWKSTEEIKRTCRKKRRQENRRTCREGVTHA